MKESSARDSTESSVVAARATSFLVVAVVAGAFGNGVNAMTTSNGVRQDSISTMRVIAMMLVTGCSGGAVLLLLLE